ncbi:MAG: 1-phosphofructokinase family hexose kinase [Pedobacter sp.]|nr:MAG: 1-phosphofructokinase family hexose kinase [Pedobacter sp.]
MGAIYTLTFSPCIDTCTTVDGIFPTQKLRCASPEYTAGGGGINVARALKELGNPATAVFPAGGCNGKKMVRLLKDEEILTSVVTTGIETRENFIVLDTKNGLQYRFGLPPTPLKMEQWEQCLDVLRQATLIDAVVISGSFPDKAPKNFFKQIVGISHLNKAKLFVDSSPDNLTQALKLGVYLIKPNLDEFFELARAWNIKSNDVTTAARELIQKSRCEMILVSLGKDGATLITKSQSLTVSAPDVTVQSTLGAGDSMLAGMVYSLVAGTALRESLIFGVCCGTAATLQPGANLFKKSDVEFFIREFTPFDNLAKLAFDW